MLLMRVLFKENPISSIKFLQRNLSDGNSLNCHTLEHLAGKKMVRLPSISLKIIQLIYTYILNSQDKTDTWTSNRSPAQAGSALFPEDCWVNMAACYLKCLQCLK